ncbi:MAG: S8 family serine peptidase, partial [Bdellovibrio sp.]|nr:S8 family serine peptidase [Bdellovibrio sp.]
SGQPNDLDFSKLWGLYNTGQKDSAGQIGVPGSDIGVLPLWDQGLLGSHDIIVAVIDTGVQWDHPDLKENIYVNPGEIAGNGKDDDGNGFVDDVSGWNFITKQGNSQDDNGHGTHVSGTIGALGNNETGVVGVNWHVSILPIKFLSESGSGTLEDAVEAIRYATKMKAKIMSNSWGGGGFSQAMLDTIVEARNAGILFVAAAGNSATDNDSTPMYPASYSAENVIAVAATDNQDKLADFSCFGKKTVHVAAPGVNIYSTLKGSSYDTYSGTSMATPHISGIAALLWSANPDWTFDVIKQRLIQTSTPIRALKSKVTARGRVNIFNAYYNIIPPNDEPGENEWFTEDRALESEHPYKDNQNLTWTIEKSGVKYLRVYFEKVSVEKRYDHVYVEDAVGIAVNDLTGSFQNYTSDYVDGEVIKIRLKTDVNITDYGFKITKIQYVPKK